ncbi:MAG TPA: M13 family metallopeptidase [Acidobacteriaceae bacterium]|nr:M13 family metallopeptidase [Acidobacteriaceae bacterium]
MKIQLKVSTLLPVSAVICMAVSCIAANAQEKTQPETHGISVANMDRSISPGDNFYLYSNGDWIKRTVIPQDRAEVGVFSALDDLSNQRTADLIENAAKSNAAAGSNERKIADLYNSYMNEAAIEATGLTPLRPHLQAIAAIKNKQELARALGDSIRADVDPLNDTNFQTIHLFGLWTAPGFQDSTHYHAYLLQGGLGLPSRDLYLKDDAQSKKLLAAYQVYLATMLKLAGFTDTDARAARVVQLEREIAEKHASLADSEDIHKADNLWRRADFSSKAPGLDWAEFFRGAGLNGVEDFDVWQPQAFVGESALVASTPLDTWKDWLAVHLIMDYAAVLPKEVADENFNFFGKTLYGVPQQRPRWQRSVAIVNVYLGDAVGQIYAQHYFPPQAKAEAQAMVANIIAAFRVRIQALSWMAPATKAEAEAKLNALYVGVGYPETWKNYSAYEVKSDDIFGNVWRGRIFEYRRQIARLGGNVDRKEWCMDPQTVNAVNLPLQIALNFPAAILQPPFFDPKAPAASNYGAIGSIIGHEISHTFDTEGSTFDAEGRLRNWWTPADLAHFDASTAKLAAQYDTYKPFPDLSVDGKQTLGENIADVAGISAAYDGYRASLKEKAAPRLEGFSGDQQFFIAFGQNWGEKIRPAALRQQVLTDPHAPAEYRAATVRNIDAWYKAFDVKAGQTLYLAPDDRVRIW